MLILKTRLRLDPVNASVIFPFIVGILPWCYDFSQTEETVQHLPSNRIVEVSADGLTSAQQ